MSSMATATPSLKRGSSMPQAWATAKVSWGRTRAPPGNTAWRTAPANLGGQLGSSADAKAMARHCSILVIAFMRLSPINVKHGTSDNYGCHLCV